MGRLIGPGWNKDWMDEWMDGWIPFFFCWMILFHDVVSRWILDHATYLHTRHKRQFFLFILRFPFRERWSWCYWFELSWNCWSSTVATVWRLKYMCSRMRHCETSHQLATSIFMRCSLLFWLLLGLSPLDPGNCTRYKGRCRIGNTPYSNSNGNLVLLE